MSKRFNEFCANIWTQRKYKPPTHSRILALDPGETTGWALFTSEITQRISAPNPDLYLSKPTPILPEPLYPTYQLEACGQADTWPMENSVHNLTALLSTQRPTFVVHERYAVYNWKAQSHSWSEVPTVQVIGTILTLAAQQHIPTTNQTAQVAKGFCTDTFLKTMTMYQPGQRHARDAIRHGTYYIMFGNKVDQ